ncbi:hypothetical protein EJB05_28261, partial [Eragrostis curvula]
MGRGRPRNKRPRPDNDGGAATGEEHEEEEEPALFPVGTPVEVRSDDQGFQGSYYEATVVGHTPSGRGYVVAYATLTTQEGAGGEPLRERAAAADVRPRPPEEPRRRAFAVHETVEAFHNDGWWAGVVRRVAETTEAAPADGGGEGDTPPQPAPPRRVYTVCFPATREVLEFDEARVRPRLVFKGDRWVPAAEAEKGNPMFREGSQVEVSRSAKTFGEYWSPATVLKVIDATSFLVQYGDVREDGELVTEILDAQYVRPARNIFPMESKYRFPPFSFVEVFREGSWWPGSILEILDDKFVKKYVVKINSHETAMDDVECVDVLTVEHTLLRPRYDWHGRKWVRCLTEKQFNRGPQLTSGKRPISAACLSSNDIDNVAAAASCTRDESVSSIKENMNNADIVLHAVCPDPLVCNENIQVQQKQSSYLEESVKQQNSVLALKSPLALPSQLSMTGFGHLKYDPNLFRSSQLQLPPPRMVPMSSVPQTGGFQASLFGAFGQLRPLPRGPALGIQSVNPYFGSIAASKKAFTVHEEQPTDKGYYLMANPEQNFNAGSSTGTDLPRKRKECVLSGTQEDLGGTPDNVLKKKRIVDKSAEETSHSVASSEDQMRTKSDCGKELPNAATHPLSETNTVTIIDSTPEKDNKGSQEKSIFLRESSVVDEVIPSGIPLVTDELHQGDYIGTVRPGANEVSVLSENLVLSVVTLDKPCEANALPSDSSTHQYRKATEAQNSEISMEQETVEEFCQQALIVANDATVDLLPSEKSCETTRNGHQVHDDNMEAMVECTTCCVFPTENVSTMAVPMSSDVVPNLLPSSENCDANKKLDMGLADSHGSKVGLTCNDMPEILCASAEGPTSLHDHMGDASVKQSSTKKSQRDEQHGVPDKDCSTPMVEFAVGSSQSTDKSALTQLSSADMSSSTEVENGNRLIEPKDAGSTPMSKYVPCRTRDSCCPLLQRSLDVHKSILADRPSESLAVENLPFVKTSPMWAHIEAMEIFSKVPQRPNFHQFQQLVPELREGMALGLMLSFASLADSINQLNIQDENSLFEEKMEGLSSLEAHGFDVTHLRSHLETQLHMKKSRAAELQDAIKKLEEKIAQEETVDRQLSTQISTLNSTICQLELHTNLLRGITQTAVSQKINCAWEISRLKTELKHLFLSAQKGFAAPR